MSKDTTQPRDTAGYDGIANLAGYGKEHAISGHHLNELDALFGIQSQLNIVVAQAVSAARQDGKTWAEIGGTLGMSKQAAQQRFGKAM